MVCFLDGYMARGSSSSQQLTRLVVAFKLGHVVSVPVTFG